MVNGHILAPGANLTNFYETDSEGKIKTDYWGNKIGYKFKWATNYVTGLNLSNANLWKGDFSHVNSHTLNLSNAKLNGAKFHYAELGGANLTGADFSPAHGQITDFNQAKFTHSYYGDAILTGANFTGVNLSWANMTGMNLTGMNFTGAIMHGVDFTGANLSGVISGGIIGTPKLPDGYKMIDGTIIGPYMNFVGKDFTGADFINLDLTGVNFTNAKLSGARFSNSTLTNVIFGNYANGQGADTTNAIFDNVKSGGVDISMRLFYARKSEESDSYGRELSKTRRGIVDRRYYGYIGNHWAVVAGYIVGRNIDLTGVDFGGYADFRGGGHRLNGTKFYKANLYRANFRDMSLQNVDFTEAHLDEANFEFTLLERVNFTGAYLVDSSFRFAAVKYDWNYRPWRLYPGFIHQPVGVNFTHANMRRVDWSSADFINQTFVNASLKDAKHDTRTVIGLNRPPKLRGANFTGADLTNVDLETDLSYANFTNATLVDADFGSSFLAQAEFAGANTDGFETDLDERTKKIIMIAIRSVRELIPL
jgi:uncharacterized protein YjbI with pentapeptide repeats